MADTDPCVKTIAAATLRRLESFALFAALMLAITLEGGCVYWLCVAGLHARPVATSNLVGQWATSTLPQCWLQGALLVLLYRALRMLIPPTAWDSVARQHNRRAFLRVWRWAMAVGAVQIGALYLDRLAMGVR